MEVLLDKENIKFSAIYRSHETTVNNFIDELYLYLQNSLNFENHFILGDMNLDILKNNTRIDKYLNNFLELGYKSLVNIPTRIMNDSATCIDHIFAKVKNCDKNILTIVCDVNITDHFATMIHIPLDHNYNNQGSNNMCTKKIINYAKLIELLSNETWIEVFTEADTNTTVDKFIDILQNLINHSEISKQYTNKNKPRREWITKGIIKSCQIKSKLYKKTKQSPLDSQIRVKYNKYKNKLKTLIKAAKEKYYSNLIQELTNNPKKLWDFVKDLSGERSSKNKTNKIEEIISPLTNETLTEAKDIANEFNTFFTEIGPKMAEKFDGISADYDELIKRNPNSMFIRPTDEQEIKDIVKKMNIKKSAGVNQVSIGTLKIIIDYISCPLELIFNKCFKNSIFPVQFKKADVKPIFKNGDVKNPSNYRPISLISNFAKIFETIIKNRMISFINKSKLLNHLQFGFREKKSTEQAILKITDQIYNAIDCNIPCMTIFLDLAKAFDTVNHEIMLGKLEKMGFRGNVRKLFQSYLNDRFQRVVIDGIESSEKRLTCGVPQGTILGPILFIIYINDIFEVLADGEITSYADDTALVITDVSWTQLIPKAEVKINKLAKWLINNHLTLNISKTVLMTFGSYTNSLPIECTLRIHDTGCNAMTCNCTPIKRVKVSKYLGIFIDDNLKWNDHITHTSNKTRYLIYLFYKLRKTLNEKQLIMIYYALFWSVAVYGIIAWGGTYTNNILSLCDIQKRIIKIIYKKSVLYPSEELYTEKRILSLRKFFVAKAIIFNFQEMQGKYILKKQTLKRNLSLDLPNIKKEIGRRTHYYIGYKAFNKLIYTLKIDISIKTDNLKRIVRHWLLETLSLQIERLFKSNDTCE